MKMNRVKGEFEPEETERTEIVITPFSPVDFSQLISASSQLFGEANR